MSRQSLQCMLLTNQELQERCTTSSSAREWNKSKEFSCTRIYTWPFNATQRQLFIFIPRLSQTSGPFQLSLSGGGRHGPPRLGSQWRRLFTQVITCHKKRKLYGHAPEPHSTQRPILSFSRLNQETSCESAGNPVHPTRRSVSCPHRY